MFYKRLIHIASTLFKLTTPAAACALLRSCPRNSYIILLHIIDLQVSHEVYIITSHRIASNVQNWPVIEDFNDRKNYDRILLTMSKRNLKQTSKITQQ